MWESGCIVCIGMYVVIVWLCGCIGFVYCYVVCCVVLVVLCCVCVRYGVSGVF